MITKWLYHIWAWIWFVPFISLFFLATMCFAMVAGPKHAAGLCKSVAMYLELLIKQHDR